MEDNQVRDLWKTTVDTLSNPDSTADKIIANKRASMDMAKKLGADELQLKNLSNKMNNMIKETRRKATGVLSANKVGDALGKSKKLGRKIPGLGMVLAGITALTDSPSAAASELVEGVEEAIIPGGVKGLGPQAGSPGAILEDANASNEEKEAAAKSIMDKYKTDPVIGKAQQAGYNYDADKATIMAEAENNPVLNDIRKAARRDALMSKIGDK